MKKEKLSIKPRIMELNDTNDIYMTLNICILSNDVNYNKAQFLDDFIDGVIENKKTYIGIPFVVNREKLENADYENLSHELKDGLLLTDQIGSFVNFWKEEIDDANCLLGEIRVMKRFPNTCNAIIELYNNGDLETSCEVLISSYASVNDDGIRTISYSDGNNALIGSAIVTSPAEKRAKATLLVAEAYQKDIDEKEVESVTKDLKVFNKGNDIKFHVDVNELSHDDIRQQIYNHINPVNPETDERSYKYWIREVFQTHFIVEGWEDGDKLYSVEYSIVGDSVTVSSTWQQVEVTYQPVGVNLASEMAELNQQLTKVKEEIASMSENKTVEVQELESKIIELNTKIDELNNLIVQEKESKTTLEGQITELNSKVEELSPFKIQVESAEKLAKVTEVSNKYSKLLSEETFKSEETQTLINELKVTELNELVVSEIAKQKVDVEVASKTTEDVIIVASKQEDLVTKDKHEFWASPRS